MGIGNADDKEVVAFAGFTGDGLGPGCVLPRDDVDRPRFLLVRMSFERGRRFGGSFDRVFGRSPIGLCVVPRLPSRRRRSFGLFSVLFGLGDEIEDGRRFASGAGDNPGQLRGEFAIGAVIGRDQEAFEIGHESFCVQLLTL